MQPSMDWARGSLPATEMSRLKHCFEHGIPAYAKVKRYDGWYVGVHMGGLPFMQLVEEDGCWGIGRKVTE